MWFNSPAFCSSIRVPFIWYNCIQKFSREFICQPFLHDVMSSVVIGIILYSCLLRRMCVAYADCGLLDLICVRCSENLVYNHIEPYSVYVYPVLKTFDVTT
jgi:hypothetical protein